ncbi:uncharacterized protein [Solanum lycopersicum]|uniref:uncharacterized protein isoform X1 n=2 Tax=Solanum lycopersicum TaxID=4081 RepID=UPI003749220D
MKGHVINVLGRLAFGIIKYKLEGSAQLHTMGSRKKNLNHKSSKFLNCGTEWRDFRPEITYEILCSMSLLASCILLVIHWFLIPLIKTAKVLQQVDKKFISIVAGTTLPIINQGYIQKVQVHANHLQISL